VPDFEWQLRLFLSVDLVGSTAYKVTEAKSEAPGWSHTFREFFRDFPLAIDKEASRLSANYAKCQEVPRPWKFSGDEILFWVTLANHHEAATHIASFKKALISFPEQWRQKSLPLKLKATAWIAGFPVTNSEIIIENGSTSTVDFIGPSIDAGFRLTKFSQPRKFILSADLALMLLDAIYRLELPWHDFHLFFDGTEPLKGVLDGEPYPIIWLDMNDGQQSVEEMLLGTSREAKPHVLKQYLAKFVDEKMVRPFIVTDPDERYKLIPASLQKKFDRMKEIEEQTSNTGGDADQGGNELDLPPPDPIDHSGFIPGVPG
jgi:hypothetical protein